MSSFIGLNYSEIKCKCMISKSFVGPLYIEESGIIKYNLFIGKYILLF